VIAQDSSKTVRKKWLRGVRCTFKTIF
jgi:hypothetical protein